MDFHVLNYFVSVAQEQSLTKAAEKLFVTPSTISQCISKEEKELGVTLFVRSRERWTLTAAGQMYVDGCKKILEISKSTESAIRDIVNEDSGEFTIGVTPGRGATMFAMVFPLFKEKYPNVRIHTIEANSKRLQRFLADGTVDFYLMCHHNPEKSVPDTFTCEFLANEDCVLFVRKDHPVAELYNQLAPSSPLTVDLSLFKDDYFIGYNKETAMYNTVLDIFRKADITPKILFESSSAVVIHKLVMSGIGLAILPELYAAQSENARFFHITPTVTLQNVVVYNPRTHITKAMRCFIDMAKQFFEDYKIKGYHV